MVIPRVFHRIWLGSKPIPAEFQEFGKTWERLHAGWTMMLWTDGNIPPLVNQEAFDQAPSFAAKADILRYEILLKEGGVYVDTDFECLRNIEPLLGGVDCFVAQQRELEADFGRFCYVNNALMGAVPGHGLFKDMVELLRPHMRSLPPDVPASYLTGPHFLTTVLQAHPEVKVFPACFFYPYTATERWRRYEKFPDAYAVHHWTLNDVSVMRMKPRKLGDGQMPCLTVILNLVRDGEPIRLRWVLEGLCRQTVTDFEVLVAARSTAEHVAAQLHEFGDRLQCRFIALPENAPGTRTSAALRNTAMSHARAARVLFLDSDCLPDPEVVETHARYAGKAMLLFGFRRVYPEEKMFPYRDAVDYGGLLQHCVPERRDLYVVPSADRWREISPSCFSLAAPMVQTLGGFNEQLTEGEVLALAKKLSEAGCPTVPCIYGARVTQLGPERIELTGTSPAIQQAKLRLNESIAKLRKRGVSAGQGLDGKSPYFLRIATLNGAREQQISALLFNLLNEFHAAHTPSEAIANVTRRVAIDPDKLQRVGGLCASYISQYTSAGILVPMLTPESAGTAQPANENVHSERGRHLS